MFKKTTMSLALTAAMIGGVVMTQQATALPQSPAVEGNPYVSVNGLGQALIYPYYTVREGFKTSINVFNTSSDHAIAVKVRFREYQNSRDVLDFNLVLSPNDKWSGIVAESATTGAVLTTGDKSCTIPAILSAGAPFSASGYSGSFKDSGDAGIERLKSGYIEIIPMAWTDVTTNPVYKGALHAQPAGVPSSCTTVVNAFAPTAPAWNYAAAPMDGNQLDGAPAIAAYKNDNDDPIWEAIPVGENPLFGELGLFNKDGGVAGGTNAIAIADWMSGTPLLTAQEFPYYLEPTLATSAGLWDTTNIGLTDAALTSSEVINEWANNATNGADVDWVVTMPTKSFHADVSLNNIQAGSSHYRTNGNTGDATNVASGRTPLPPFENQFASGVSESSVTLNKMYNNEEGQPGGTTGEVHFSPGSFTTTNPTLKYEANVITFCGEDVAACNGEDVLKSGVNTAGTSVALRLDPVTTVPGAKSNGFIKLGVPGKNNNGLPMVGFGIKSRTLGDATLAFGQLFDHKWK